jgi:hypothetical protein
VIPGLEAGKEKATATTSVDSENLPVFRMRKGQRHSESDVMSW